MRILLCSVIVWLCLVASACGKGNVEPDLTGEMQGTFLKVCMGKVSDPAVEADLAKEFSRRPTKSLAFLSDVYLTNPDENFKFAALWYMAQAHIRPDETILNEWMKAEKKPFLANQLKRLQSLPPRKTEGAKRLSTFGSLATYTGPACMSNV
ncbi:MAG: hypothetical protein ABL962_01325 [Fimbriimonadaceae bacterium]